MSKNSLNDWSTTPSSNTDIAGTNIAVNCPPADVGVFMRTIMAQIAYAVQGSGGTIPATWNVGNLIAATVTVGTLIVTGTPPGVQLGDMKHSSLGIEGAGWRLCNGQTRPQSDPFWVYMVANSLTGSWLPGFTGSSTYNMPNAQDVVLVGLDAMGGAASPGLLTAAVAGFNPAIMLAIGGNQNAQQDTITISTSGSISLVDPGHTHPVTVPQGVGAAAGPYTSLSGNSTQVVNTGTSTTGASIQNTQTITAASGLTGTSQNIQPSMMAAVLMFVGA